MNKKAISLVCAGALSMAACKKSDQTTAGTDFDTLKKDVLVNFTHNIAIEGYKDLDEASVGLFDALTLLNAEPTEAHLTAARDDWKQMRAIWEQCEGFLFGPVEDNDYDPNMDTWPTDYAQMDSLLVSNNPLELTDIQNATLSLRGFHPIEYILFGNHGSRTAAGISDRQKKYMLALATDLKNTCHALHTSWTGETGFGSLVISAGSGSSKYAKMQEVYIAIIDGMTAICEEVGEGKMKEPFDALNPAIVESPYSGNSIADFRNNIVGLQNVYLGRYKTDGAGINDLVAARNRSLDNKIQSQISAALLAFDNITVNFETAITEQRLQVQQTMDALAQLRATLDGELKPFVLQNITD